MGKPKAKKTKPWDRDAFIKNELRKAFKRSPQYHEAIAAAKEEFFVQSKHGKPMRRIRIRCAGCGRAFLNEKPNPIAVDHILPIERVDEEGLDLNTYCDRLFCDLDNLQILCNYSKERADEFDGIASCHKVKTAAENAARKAFKKTSAPKKGKKK